eukprot:GHVU01113043.1.p1 GENE.GHVU01113043.1~~GHVU01113043.1.p1  ORF type:complete len:328 (-),score=42.40 GHVU01113043.1:127-1110(-)
MDGRQGITQPAPARVAIPEVLGHTPALGGGGVPSSPGAPAAVLGYSHGGGASGRSGNTVLQQQQQQQHPSQTRLHAPPGTRVLPTQQQYLAPPQGSLPPPHGYHRTSPGGGAAAGGGEDRDYRARMAVPQLSNIHLHQPLLHHQPGAAATAAALPTPVMGGGGGITAAAALQQQHGGGGGSSNRLAIRPGAWIARPNDGGHMSGRVASMAQTSSGLVAPRQSPPGGAAQPRQQQQQQQPQSAAAPTGVSAQLSNANRGRFSIPPALHNATAGRHGSGTRPGGGGAGIPHGLVSRRADGPVTAGGRVESTERADRSALCARRGLTSSN